ncbi:MAG TPA: type II toxin-antitoxin system RelE/ParE family toxin [Candidatus Paceibacterota bacterium]|nr:type II toxin-antitoxin system RelE/ParE family toxin [Candidatus Paceibacterota bacterium]
MAREDIPALSRTWKAAIRAAIEEKLMIAPADFGKPLRQSLRGYRKLRVGDYRIVFRIEERMVYVIAILHRSVVYRDAGARGE